MIIVGHERKTVCESIILKSMKVSKIVSLVSLLLMTSLTISSTSAADYYGGNSGLGFLYSSEGVFTGTVDIRGFTIGIFGKNWSTAEERDPGTSNYGRTKIGNFDSIYGIDLGYSYPVAKYLRIGVEVSGGQKTTYGKYSDNRFTEGYYISEEESKWITGVGVTAAVPVTKNIEIVINSNTLKGGGGGVIFRF
jgi:hypothetical protein